MAMRHSRMLTALTLPEDFIQMASPAENRSVGIYKLYIEPLMCRPLCGIAREPKCCYMCVMIMFAFMMSEAQCYK